jgi:hypothetical protein
LIARKDTGKEEEGGVSILAAGAVGVAGPRCRSVILKVGVVAGLLGGDAAGRVVDEHHLEQIQPGVVEVRAKLRVRVALPLGEGRLEVRVDVVVGDAGPGLLGGRAQESDQG